MRPGLSTMRGFIFGIASDFHYPAAVHSATYRRTLKVRLFFESVCLVLLRGDTASPSRVPLTPFYEIPPIVPVC